MSTLKAMLHVAIAPATCNATKTNENHCKLRWTSSTQQLVSQRCEKQSILLLLFLQQQNGLLHGQLFSQRLMRCKLREKLPCVTWPLQWNTDILNLQEKRKLVRETESKNVLFDLERQTTFG